MKVALVAPFALAPKGTTSARVLPMARALARLGHECLVLIPPYDNPGEARSPLHDNNLTLRWLLPSRLRRIPAIGLLEEQLSMARRATVILQQWDPDVIHTFKPKAVSGLVQLQTWFRRGRAALVLDCDDWEGRLGWNKLERYPLALQWLIEFQESFSLTRNDGVSVASRELERRQRGLGGPVERIPNFYDRDRHAGWDDPGLRARGRGWLGVADDATLALLYTRFFEYPVEGYSRLVSQFLERLPGSKLVVVGAGKYGQHEVLRRLLISRGMADRVIFKGWTDPSKLPLALAAADVALMPSQDTVATRAKCPARLLDLLVMGVPIAAHDVGETNTFVVHDGNGRLVAPDDPDPLVEAAVGLVCTAARQRAAATARDLLAGPLSAETAANSLERLYEQAKRRRAARR